MPKFLCFLPLQAKDTKLQKKSYRVLEEICCSNSTEEFISSNLTAIQDVLVNNLTTASSVSKAVMKLLALHLQCNYCLKNIPCIPQSHSKVLWLQVYFISIKNIVSTLITNVHSHKFHACFLFCIVFYRCSHAFDV